MPLVDEVGLARALNRDPAAIRVAAKAGRITKRPDGLYDLETAIAEFNATTHHEKGHNNRNTLPEMPAPDMQPMPAETKSTAYAKARANTQIYVALDKKARYEERIKTLTPTAEVETARFTEFRTLRDACFNIPARIAAILASESDVARCQQLLEDELTTVFTAFADGKLAA